MKKIFLAVLFATVLISNSFANDNNKVSWVIAENFAKEFRDVSQVEWTIKEHFVKASFVEEGTNKEAFYTHDGDLISTSMNVVLKDLPLVTKRAFAKKYTGYILKEAVKLEGPHETAYYLSIENDNESLILKNWNSSVTVFKKQIKK